MLCYDRSALEAFHRHASGTGEWRPGCAGKRRRMMGRPQVKIDLAQLEKLCAMMYTDSDLARFFRCSVRTIERRKCVPDFLEAMERGRAKAKVALRRAQWKAAMEGDVRMLIFLGKQYLGQTEKGMREPSGFGGPMDFDRVRDQTRRKIARLLKPRKARASTRRPE
jgi:hypothetical protein